MTLTPVEWLIQELKKNGKAVEHYDLLLQAKRIEKQQIIDNCNECASDIFRGHISVGKPIGEQFYNKKYSR
jgi:hypothetical protein